MQRRFIAFYLFAAVVAPGLAGASVPYSERVREHVLANGLKVLLLEDHKAPVGVVQLWYRVGSRNEHPGSTGLSHVLEHMMFKGTEKHGPEDYSRIIQRNGGNENAFTTADATAYFATLASDRLRVELELEADRMRNLQFAEELFTPELKVIMEERRLRVDSSPVSGLVEQLKSTAYAAHPYQWPVIGWMTDLQQTLRSDALAYYRLHYAPNNAVLIVVGDFTADDLLRQIDELFGAIPAGTPPPIVRSIEPTQEGERRVTFRKPAELPWIAIGYHTPNGRDSDALALEVAGDILAGGKSARLYEDMVYKRRIARSASADYDMSSIDPGMFMLYAQPMPGKPVPTIEKALLEHVARLQAAPPTAEEMERTKAGIEASFVLAQDSLFYQGMLLGQYEMAGGWRRLDDYLPGIAAVTPEDVQRVASYYLTPENRTVAILDPLPVPPGRSAPAGPPPSGPIHHRFVDTDASEVLR